MTISISEGSRGWQFIEMATADLDEAMHFASSSARRTSLLFNASRCQPDMLSDLAQCRDAAHVRAITLLGDWPNLAPLEGLTGLDSLTIGVASRMDFSKLLKLTEVGGVWSPKWKGLEQCRQLKVFAVSSYNGKIATIPQLQRLERISLIKTSIKSMDGLHQATNLVELEISYAKDLSNLSDLHACARLETLLLSHCKKVESFDALRTLKKLRDLSISEGGQIPSIAFIENLPSLEYLGIYGTKVIDGDLQPCVEHPRLKTLASKNDRNYKPAVAAAEKLLAEKISQFR